MICPGNSPLISLKETVNEYMMHYSELARGVSHLKVTGGQKNMCEAVQKYAEEYAKEYAKEYAAKEKSVSVKNLMHNMKLNLDEALNALGIQGDERELIIAQLQEQQ